MTSPGNGSSRSILVSGDAFTRLCEIAGMLKESTGRPPTFSETVDFVLAVADGIIDAA